MNNIETLAFSEFVLNLCARMQFGLLPVNVDSRYHKVNEALYKFVSVVCKTNQMLGASDVVLELLESPFLWTESDFRFFLSDRCNTGLSDPVKQEVTELQSLQQIPLNSVLVNTDGVLRVITKDADKLHENWLTVLLAVFTAVVVYNDFYVQHRSMVGCPVVLPHRFWELFGEIRSSRRDTDGMGCSDKASVIGDSVPSEECRAEGDKSGVEDLNGGNKNLGFKVTGHSRSVRTPGIFGLSKLMSETDSEVLDSDGKKDAVIELLRWLYDDANSLWYINLGDDSVGDRRIGIEIVPVALQELLTELGVLKRRRLFKYVKKPPKKIESAWQTGVDVVSEIAPINDERELHTGIISEFTDSERIQQGSDGSSRDINGESGENVDKTSLFGS